VQGSSDALALNTKNSVTSAKIKALHAVLKINDVSLSK
jgi:hypothetical protein